MMLVLRVVRFVAMAVATVALGRRIVQDVQERRRK